MSKPETFEFQTEARQLLDLMIHSIYSHKEIFLRELISNASDALDKLRFEALENPALNPLTADLHVRIDVDKVARQLTISDNGIGMTRDEVIRYIGTIAKSGTKDYLQALKQAQGSAASPDLIGQFGVGFYSSFIAADKVTLVTRHATEDKAWRWESDGGGSYTLEETTRETPGTSVTLHLRPHDQEDGLEDYTQEWPIRNTVKKYSDFVSYPIRMEVVRSSHLTEEEEKAGKTPETTLETVVLNSMQAIWTRPESEVKDEEYQEFYKH
ncbi:TPA: molecular chaperone HtpG, partial [Candidatus Sumerlaeota bacterium]|nr:molecular chaperone HtpG [Candidatus Sumerlaeota bacterium]